MKEFSSQKHPIREGVDGFQAGIDAEQCHQRRLFGPSLTDDIREITTDSS